MLINRKIYSSVFSLLLAINTTAQENRQLAIDKPMAIADLRTDQGASLVKAKWYVQPANLVQADFRAPGPKSSGEKLALYPTGMPLKTHTISPQIGSIAFDNGFKEIKPTDLERREGMGLVSFVWFKTDIILPANIGGKSIEGTTAVFEIVVDDYSEIWINGKQQVGFGQSGNGLISGYNNRNRVLLTNNAKPGDTFSIAVLGINGPLGKIPENYIWVRSAVIDFYKDGLPTKNGWKDIGRLYSIHPSFNKIIAPETKVEKLADGFSFTEGPVWHPDGYLLFSDPNTNTIYRYDPSSSSVTVFMSHSGYTGPDIWQYGQPGSNGLAIDKEQRLIIDQHGNRRVIRIEKKGPVTVLSDNFEGKKLNSPNDIVLKSDGSIYFTDPPYGLPGFFNDKNKELNFSGIYMIRNNKTSLLSTDLGGPNGIAFSPDEKYLYVGNWDIRSIHSTKTVWRFEVQEDGTLKNGKIFFDFNDTEDEEAVDGIKVDKSGNLFVSAPGGIWVISPEATLLGKIITPERPANMAWGDADGKTLYLTAHSSLYKIRVTTGGKFSWE